MAVINDNETPKFPLSILPHDQGKVLPVLGIEPTTSETGEPFPTQLAKEAPPGRARLACQAGQLHYKMTSHLEYLILQFRIWQQIQIFSRPHIWHDSFTSCVSGPLHTKQCSKYVNIN